MRSRHLDIADDLRQQITAGSILPSERLPSETALADRYGISTVTLRRALAVLQGEGLVEKIHGKGNFVRRPPRKIMYGAGCGTLDPWTAAEPDLRVTIRSTAVQAQAHLATLLKVPTGSPVVEFTCLSREGESPHGLARVYMPHDLAPARSARRCLHIQRGSHEVRLPRPTADHCPRDGECPPPYAGRSVSPPDQHCVRRPLHLSHRHRLHRPRRRSNAPDLPGGSSRRRVHHPPRDRRKAEQGMTAPNELRLLKWSGPEGKPCYLSTDERGGYMSRLADNIEAVQLGTATELLEEAYEALNDRDVDLDEMRRLANKLSGALRDILRVAISRGHLLAVGEPRP